MSGPNLQCPRCGSTASIILGFDFPEGCAEIEPLGIVVCIELAAMASCAASCGEPAIDIPVDVKRYAASGGLPPAAFSEESKAWYRTESA